MLADFPRQFSFFPENCCLREQESQIIIITPIKKITRQADSGSPTIEIMHWWTSNHRKLFRAYIIVYIGCEMLRSCRANLIVRLQVYSTRVIVFKTSRSIDKLLVTNLHALSKMWQQHDTYECSKQEVRDAGSSMNKHRLFASAWELQFVTCPNQ